jgi:hypothetical protein
MAQKTMVPRIGLFITASSSMKYLLYYAVVIAKYSTTDKDWEMSKLNTEKGQK